MQSQFFGRRNSETLQQSNKEKKLLLSCERFTESYALSDAKRNEKLCFSAPLFHLSVSRSWLRGWNGVDRATGRPVDVLHIDSQKSSSLSGLCIRGRGSPFQLSEEFQMAQLTRSGALHRAPPQWMAEVSDQHIEGVARGRSARISPLGLSPESQDNLQLEVVPSGVWC